MRLIKRDPRAGYFDSWFWIPKTHARDIQIRATFSYEGRNGEVVKAWREEPHHYRVPRNYLSPGALGSLPFPVYDSRWTAFPRVELKSNVVLDALNPKETYQREGSEALLAVNDGILCLRCGAGKTAVALHSAAQLGVPILVVVDEAALAVQWMDEIESLLGVPRNEIGRIGGHGSPFDWEHAITVAVVHSLASRAKDNRLPVEMLRHFGVIIADEAHVMGAPYFNQAIPPFHGRRWGLSATPTREDGFDSLLRFTLGPVVYTYLEPEEMPLFYFKRLDTRMDFGDSRVVEETHDVDGNFHFGKTYGYLARAHPERTDAIAQGIQSALDNNRQVLVLTHSRDMIDELEKRFPQAGICHGGVKGEERFRRIRECNPVIAIMKVGKQALNKPSLDTCFVCEPFTKAGTLQQTMGRILRAFAGKKKPVFVIYEDRYIPAMAKACGKIRTLLNRWPKHKGGRIPHKTV